MGASGMSGAYMTEKAERTKKLKDLERAMLTNMKDGLHGKSHRFAAICRGCHVFLSCTLILRQEKHLWLTFCVPSIAMIKTEIFSGFIYEADWCRKHVVDIWTSLSLSAIHS